MFEIIGFSIAIIFLLVAYFVGKISKDKQIRKKYLSEINYMLEDADRLKDIINKLLNKSINKKDKDNLEQVKLKITFKIEKPLRELLLEVLDLNEGNEYKKSGIIYKLKEEFENIEEYLSEIQEEIGDDKENTIKHLTAGFYQRLELKEYEYLAEMNEKMGMYFYKEIEYTETKKLYVFILGTVYQELGKFNYAEKYFDIYFDCLDLDEEKKMLLLIKNLDNLGLSYKVSK